MQLHPYTLATNAASLQVKYSFNSFNEHAEPLTSIRQVGTILATGALALDGVPPRQAEMIACGLEEPPRDELANDDLDRLYLIGRQLVTLHNLIVNEPPADVTYARGVRDTFASVKVRAAGNQPGDTLMSTTLRSYADGSYYARASGYVLDNGANHPPLEDCLGYVVDNLRGSSAAASVVDLS